MKVVVTLPVEIELCPGDKVILMDEFCQNQVEETIVRLTETEWGTYAVFTNDTWRPITSYGLTWRKVGGEK